MHISSCISIHQRRLVHRNYFRFLLDNLTYMNVDKIKYNTENIASSQNIVPMSQMCCLVTIIFELESKLNAP